MTRLIRRLARSLRALEALCRLKKARKSDIKSVYCDKIGKEDYPQKKLLHPNQIEMSGPRSSELSPGRPVPTGIGISTHTHPRCPSLILCSSLGGHTIPYSVFSISRASSQLPTDDHQREC